MSNQENTNPNNAAEQDAVIEAEAVEVKANSNNDKTTQNKTDKFNNDILFRILLTLLFALIGWLSLWVFGAVVLVQFGFLLITGHLNKNLKAFTSELCEYLSDIINYVGFQKDQKPFPFQSWHYDDDNKPEQSEPAQ